MIGSVLSSNRIHELFKKKLRLISLVCMTCILLVILCPFVLTAIYYFLDISQSPVKSDVIIVLGGGGGRRANYATELYNTGYSQTIILSGYEGYMNLDIKILEEYGIPSSNIIINDKATNTYDEAQQVIAIMEERGVKSGLIVTDKFHTRRALATYQHVAYNQSIEFKVVSPDDSLIDPLNWWQSYLGDEIEQEIVKIPYYFVMYGVWSF